MPLHHTIWRVGDKPTPLSASRLNSEQLLEEMIPGTGYVGVGVVTQPMQSVKDFKITTARGELPALEALPNAEKLRRSADDPDKAEYFVSVRWLDTVDEAGALNEVGLFGNQNTVCQPRTAKWRHTVDRLKAQFTKWQG